MLSSLNCISAVYFPGSKSIGSVACPLLSVVAAWFLPFRFIVISFPFKALFLLSFNVIIRLTESPYIALMFSAVKEVTALLIDISASANEDK